jgi:murein DD-endopeptidase MepM/ murein hydrolase activator NlpD
VKNVRNYFGKWISAAVAEKAAQRGRRALPLYGRVLVCCILAIAVCACRNVRPSAAEPAGKATTSVSKLVHVVTRRDGDTTRFFVENQERGEVTMTFDFDLRNLEGSRGFPLTTTVPPNGTTEIFSLSPIDPHEPWEFSFTNRYNLGSAEAVHDDSYCYGLPYAAGKTYRVSQGYDGKYSHKGSNRYSVDWEMPEGTPVHATRGGLVVKVKDDSDKGGGDVSFDPFNNYVLIRHSDGTLGQYCHLQKGGAEVREGDVINDGDIIAHSGNTGYSTGPHLHFTVYKMKNGKERESIPVKFRTSSSEAITLEAGRKYTATPAYSSEATAHASRLLR